MEALVVYFILKFGFLFAATGLFYFFGNSLQAFIAFWLLTLVYSITSLTSTVPELLMWMTIWITITLGWLVREFKE